MTTWRTAARGRYSIRVRGINIQVTISRSSSTRARRRSIGRKHLLPVCRDCVDIVTVIYYSAQVKDLYGLRRRTIFICVAGCLGFSVRIASRIAALHLEIVMPAMS